MKLVAMIARLLLGAIFLFFGLNLFLHFLPMGPLPAGPAGQFFGALAATHYMYPVAVLQVVPAILLLINRYVPLGLTLLAPVIVNIFLVHALMAPSGLPLAVLVIVLWILVAIRVRSAFSGLFLQRVQD
jgi:putative oxidoreductase